MNADDPWQCLATCFELTAALRSDDPTAYVCKLPIHQDGSCNGLQHYAALGGDLEGAKQVNLEPSDRPQDVYSGVAQLVVADIERQAQEGNEVAIALRGKITRKTVKQTVMTSVYGVTFVGAKAQIYRALKDKGEVDPLILGVYLYHICGLIIVGFGSYCTLYIYMSQRHVSRSQRNSRMAQGMCATNLAVSRSKGFRRKEAKKIPSFPLHCRLDNSTRSSRMSALS